MKSLAKSFVALTAAIGIGGICLAGVRADDPSHEAHHPAGAATQEPQSAKPDTPAKTDDAPMTKMGGGMMDGDHMSKMMEMMQDMHGKMMGGGMPMQPKGDNGPSSLAFNGISMRMHQDMAITYTGNADIDFVKGMIPHHQAAVDMAKTVIAFGKDPEVKKLAEGVIKAQDSEITWMTDWLKKQGQ